MGRRSFTVAVAAAATLAALPAAAAQAAFTLGVAAGEVSSSSAILWAHAGRSGKVTLEVARDRRFRSRVIRKSLTARAADDNTVQARVGGLLASREYFYRFRQGSSRSDTGRFATAPRPTAAETIEFAVSGDADATPAPGSTKPFYNRFEVYRRMLAEGNDFNVNLGDAIYSDTEVGGVTTIARTVAEKWARYRANLALRNLRLLRGGGALYSHWDDHEFINDFSKAEEGETVYRAGVKAFTDYAPVTYSASKGLYRSFRWGRNLEVFFLDERSFRSAKADDACRNGQTGQPDLAPTAPKRTRDVFALIVPSLSETPSQACLDTIDDPSRTMLGARQYAAFTAAVKRSQATWKVVMNEVPIQQFYALPYDRWEGYEAERRRLLTYLRDNVRNVVFLSTDVHANLVNDARLKTLEDGGPVDSGILEATTGPVATRTFKKQIDDTTGNPSAGDLVRDAFLKPEPPNGVGMRCAVTDTYSYAQVKVTGRRLTITLKDDRGKPLKEKDGKPCGPFKLTRK